MKIMRRRSCTKPKAAMSSSTTSSSGDDADQEKTQHIINRLSKKYMAKEKDKGTAGCKKKKKVLPTGYEADVETQSSPSDSSISRDLYSFDLTNDDDIKLELQVMKEAPKSKAGTKRKAPIDTKSSGTKRKMAISGVQKQSKPSKRSSPITTGSPKKKLKTSTPLTECQKADKSSKSLKNPLLKSPKGNENKSSKTKSGPGRPFWKSFSLKDREETKRRRSQPKMSKSSMKKTEPVTVDERANVSRTVLRSHDNTDSMEVKNRSKSSPKSSNISFVDSGVFVSPELCSTRLHSPSPSTGSIDNLATPSIILAKRPSPSQSEADLGFGSFVAPPSVSPVKQSSSHSRIGDPIPMDTGSPIKSPIVEKSYSKITMIGLPYNERKKRKRCGGRYSIDKLDSWAAEMNEQFDDIENFELSIEG